jgi:cation transporter-like permease
MQIVNLQDLIESYAACVIGVITGSVLSVAEEQLSFISFLPAYPTCHRPFIVTFIRINPLLS